MKDERRHLLAASSADQLDRHPPTAGTTTTIKTNLFHSGDKLSRETGSLEMNGKQEKSCKEVASSGERQICNSSANDRLQNCKSKLKHGEYLLRQTNSSGGLPQFGIETGHQRELEVLMESIDVWGLNIFDVHHFSGEHSLSCVMMKIFEQRNLFKTFGISTRKLVNYLLNLEAHYLEVPYHNSVHAADVTQAVHVLLLSPCLHVSRHLSFKIFKIHFCLLAN